jgi:hypothetical protein
MQADAGRGCGGKSLFLLESREAYRMRLNKFAEGNTFDDAKVSMAIGGSSWDGWLKRVAERVKDRWVKREGWCGHCGKPGELKRCSGCKDAIIYIRRQRGGIINVGTRSNYYIQ